VSKVVACAAAGLGLGLMIGVAAGYYAAGKDGLDGILLVGLMAGSCGAATVYLSMRDTLDLLESEVRELIARGDGR
jgi:coenzyme F420-reducing hydrogenase delta subunit